MKNNFFKSNYVYFIRSNEKQKATGKNEEKNPWKALKYVDRENLALYNKSDLTQNGFFFSFFLSRFRTDFGAFAIGLKGVKRLKLKPFKINYWIKYREKRAKGIKFATIFDGLRIMWHRKLTKKVPEKM